MNKSKVILVWMLFYLQLGCINLMAQEPNDVLPSVPSSTAINLGIYGEVPVSLNTGVPSIGIPLFSSSGNFIGIDLNLTYHSSGIRPNIPTGVIGEGWVLNTGGCITRVVRDMPDDINELNCEGFYYSYNEVRNLYNTKPINEWKVLEEIFMLDSEPDEFNFNFLGYSGKFMMGYDGKWKIQSNDNLKVEFNGNILDPHKCFEKFTIIDGNGTKFIFGGSDAIEYSRQIRLEEIKPESFIATSWFLSKIESADGTEVIDYKYFRRDRTYFLYKKWMSKFVDGHLESSSFSNEGNVIYPIYLSTISFPYKGVEIDIKYSENKHLLYDKKDINYFGQYITNKDRFLWHKIDTVKVVQKKDEFSRIIRKFEFEYNDNVYNRLFLEKVIESSSDNIVPSANRVYEFEYNDKEAVVGCLKTMADHWGYNNMILNTNHNGYNFEVIKAPNSYVDKGILTKINYPTGGFTEFEYEPNRYGYYLDKDRKNVIACNDDGIAGGVRIKKIKSYKGYGDTIRKTYIYGRMSGNMADVKSSGILNSLPSYSFAYKYFKDNGKITWNIIPVVDVTSDEKEYITSSSNPIVPLTSRSSGNHIQYSEVNEVINNGSYTTYIFSDYNTNKDETAIVVHNGDKSPDIPYCDKGFERGRIIKKKVFNIDNKIQLKEEYVYKNRHIEKVPAVSFNFFSSNLSSKTFTAAKYNNSLDSYLLTDKVITNYFYNKNGVSSTEDVTNYEYSGINKLPKVIIERSKGVKHYNNYVDDISEEIEKANDTGIQLIDYAAYVEMNNSNMLNNPIESFSSVMSANNKEIVVSSNINRYGRHFGDKGIFVRKEKELSFRNLNITKDDYLNIEIQNKFAHNIEIDNRFIENRIYTRYNKFGKISEFKDRSGKLTSIIWGYDNIYPVIKAEGISYNNLVLKIEDLGNDIYWFNTINNGLEDDFVDFVSELRDELNECLIYSYTYDMMYGMKSATDPNNISTYYDYDDFGRLKTVYDNERNIISANEYYYAKSQLTEIIVKAGRNGKIEYDQSKRYFVGDAVTFTIKPDIGYVIKSLKVNGELVDNTLEYTISSLEPRLNTIEAEFEYNYVDFYIRSSGSGQTLPNRNQKIKKGSDLVLEFIPDSDGRLRFVTVNNDTIINNIVSGTSVGNQNRISYTLKNIQEGKSVYAEFESKKYIISYSKRGYDCPNVEPTKIIVDHGSYYNFVFDEIDNYTFKGIEVNGVKITEENNYKLDNINSDVSVSGIYELNPLKGEVLDKFNEPINNVKIELFKRGSETVLLETVYSDSNGNYQFVNNKDYRCSKEELFIKLTKSGVRFNSQYDIVNRYNIFKGVLFYKVTILDNVEQVERVQLLDQRESHRVEFPIEKGGFAFEKINVNGVSGSFMTSYHIVNINKDYRIEGVYDILPIKGKVTDQFNNPVSGVTVQVYDESTSQILETVYSNSYGNFEFGTGYISATGSSGKRYVMLSKSGVYFENPKIEITNSRFYQVRARVNWIDKTSLTFDKLGNKGQVINIQVNGNWIVESAPSWVNINSISGNGNADITVTCDVNNSMDARSGSFVIRMEGNTFRVNVTQEAIALIPNF
ncbi:MAG: hypothetical protein N4A72_23000 [Bacteroidales bacterium]|nr:hypothetical protein [Bacteroidales bacterium]